MTERLYYTDSYLTEFDADVVETANVGGRTAVILDRTAFYPTSGGQPFDTGVLGGAPVLDVLDREDGAVLHVIDGDSPRGGRVAGRVDWGRRFDHMQQHTGQHILSAAFERVLGVSTVGFHLGAAAATIDLAREVGAADIARAEEAANAVVWEDRPVTVRFVEGAELEGVRLRKAPVRSGPLRIVEISDFDRSACGGTHVARTGAVGIVAVGTVEKVRGGTRVEFRCGLRTLQAHRSLRETVAAAASLMSVAPDELPAAIARLQTENRDWRRRVRAVEERLAAHDAEMLAARAIGLPSCRFVGAVLDVLDQAGLKDVAHRIAARPGHVAALVNPSMPLSIVIARAPDVALDAAGVVKALTARFGGRGGGRPELAQGGGLQGAPDDVLAAAEALARRQEG